MANLRLKKNILEVVDNQLKANDPPCTKDTYEKLQAAGYSKSEAKDKIGAVLLEEMYGILKEGHSFDEKKYQENLSEMLQQCIDQEDDHHIRTEWDQWDELVQNGYDCYEGQKETEGLTLWQEAWDIFCAAMEQNKGIYSVSELMETQDYVYPIDGWMQDYEMELGNARKFAERIAFCRKILELFRWEDEDDSCFQCGIGDSLFDEGKRTEAYEHYEKWLGKNPRNINGINRFSWLLFENGDAQRAYEMVKKATWGVACDMENSILFMRAHQLAEYVGKPEEAKWYQEQLDKFDESIRNWEQNEDDMFDEFTVPKRAPVVKEKKVYPNDPCPCGSGKKYKKCCGRK